MYGAVREQLDPQGPGLDLETKYQTFHEPQRIFSYDTQPTYKLNQYDTNESQNLKGIVHTKSCHHLLIDAIPNLHDFCETQ